MEQRFQRFVQRYLVLLLFQKPAQNSRVQKAVGENSRSPKELELLFIRHLKLFPAKLISRLIKPTYILLVLTIKFFSIQQIENFKKKKKKGVLLWQVFTGKEPYSEPQYEHMKVCRFTFVFFKKKNQLSKKPFLFDRRAVTLSNSSLQETA